MIPTKKYKSDKYNIVIATKIVISTKIVVNGKKMPLRENTMTYIIVFYL